MKMTILLLLLFTIPTISSLHVMHINDSSLSSISSIRRHETFLLASSSSSLSSNNGRTTAAAFESSPSFSFEVSSCSDHYRRRGRGERATAITGTTAAVPTPVQVQNPLPETISAKNKREERKKYKLQPCTTRRTTVPIGSSSNNNNNRRTAIKKICYTAAAYSLMSFSFNSGMDINIDDNNSNNGSILNTNSVVRAYHPPVPVANAIYENGPNVETPIISLPSGVTYQDLRVGQEERPTVQIGDRINIQWVLKRSNGYYIDSSSNDDGVPFIFTVGSSYSKTSNNKSNKTENDGGQRENSSSSISTSRPIVGLDEGMIGMTLGGIRRIVIPLELAYVEGVEDGKPGPVPKGFGPKQRVRRVMELLKDNIPGERIVLDVKVTRIQ